MDFETGEVKWRKGDEYYQPNGYYFTLKALFDALPDKELKISQVQGDIAALLSELERIAVELSRQITVKFGAQR